MKRKATRLLSCFLVFLFVFGSVICLKPIETRAATASYAKIEANQILRKGSYYFKVENGAVFYSKEMYGEYKKAGFKGSVATVYTNGSKIVAIEDRGESFARLSRFTISSKKLKTLRKLKIDRSNYPYWTKWEITGAYGNVLFLFGGGKFYYSKTYTYNLSTGGWKKQKDKCYITDQHGRYFAAYDRCPYDDGANIGMKLYRANKNGKLTLLKDLGRIDRFVSGSGEYINGYYYYLKPVSDSSYTCHIYRCKKDGTKTKKLATVKQSSGNWVTEITPDYYETSGGKKHYY